MSVISSQILEIAVAGAGMIGRCHMALIKANPRTRLCAVIDPSPAARELAAEWAVAYFASLDEMFEEQGKFKFIQPDGVILATPNHLHVPGALTCMQHGVPALIEKPLADSLESGLKLLTALAEKPVPMLVGHHRRHSSTLQQAKQVIDSGQLGRIVTVMGSAQFYKPDSYFEQGAWRKETGGGPILINLIHEMDNLRYLCGEIESVHAIASTAVRQFAVEDTAVMTLTFTSGTLGTFTLSDAVDSPRSWEQTSGESPAYPHHTTQDCYFIAGTQGSLAVPTLHTWSYAPGEEPSWFTPFVEQTLAHEAVDPLAAQLEHFCNLILRKADPIVSVADALQSLRAVEAIRQSIATGQTVSLKDLA